MFGTGAIYMLLDERWKYEMRNAERKIWRRELKEQLRSGEITIELYRKIRLKQGGSYIQKLKNQTIDEIELALDNNENYDDIFPYFEIKNEYICLLTIKKGIGGNIFNYIKNPTKRIYLTYFEQYFDHNYFTIPDHFLDDKNFVQKLYRYIFDWCCKLNSDNCNNELFVSKFKLLKTSFQDLIIKSRLYRCEPKYFINLLSATMYEDYVKKMPEKCLEEYPLLKNEIKNSIDKILKKLNKTLQKLIDEKNFSLEKEMLQNYQNANNKNEFMKYCLEPTKEIYLMYFCHYFNMIDFMGIPNEFYKDEEFIDKLFNNIFNCWKWCRYIKIDIVLDNLFIQKFKSLTIKKQSHILYNNLYDINYLFHLVPPYYGIYKKIILEQPKQCLEVYNSSYCIDRKLMDQILSDMNTTLQNIIEKS
jgi:hypothetical protein